MYLSTNGADLVSHYIACRILRGRADTIKRSKEWEKAGRVYLRAAEMVAGVELPVSEARAVAHLAMTIWHTVQLAACLNGAAECF